MCKSVFEAKKREQGFLAGLALAVLMLALACFDVMPSLILMNRLACLLMTFLLAMLLG
jgi:hypothetical protein